MAGEGGRNSETKMLILPHAYGRRAGSLYELDGRRCHLYPGGVERLHADANLTVAPDDAPELCRAHQRYDDPVATPPNSVVNSELIREGLEGFSFFSVTPLGWSFC